MTATSRYAYRQIRESGELAIRQQEILTLLIQHPNGLTCWEMARLLTRTINSVTPRMAELQRLRTPEDYSIIVKDGTRPSVEGRRPNIVWRINPLVHARTKAKEVTL